MTLAIDGFERFEVPRADRGNADRAVGASPLADDAMNRYADGDDHAFGTLYDVLGPRLFAFVYRQTRCAPSAEDLVQQTMLQIHCARESFIRGGHVTPWAFAIARRLVIDGFRKSKFREQPMFDSDDDDEGPASNDGRPDDILYSKQLARKLEYALMALRESHRVAFQLVRLEGLSIAETAEVLGATAMAVKLRVHRTEAALRAALVDKKGGRS